MQSSSKNSYPPPELVLRKLLLPKVSSPEDCLFTDTGRVTLISGRMNLHQIVTLISGKNSSGDPLMGELAVGLSGCNDGTTMDGLSMAIV